MTCRHRSPLVAAAPANPHGRVPIGMMAFERATGADDERHRAGAEDGRGAGLGHSCPASATSTARRPSRAPCRTAATRRSAPPSGCTRSSSAAPRSPSRAPTTAAPGCTGSAPRPRTRRSPASTTARCARAPFTETVPDPNRLRWNPLPEPAARHRLPGRPVDPRRQRRRDPAHRHGRAPLPRQLLHDDRVFSDADGELLIVPERGGLLLRTEFGPAARRARARSR